MHAVKRMEELALALWSATLNSDYDLVNELILLDANVNEPRKAEDDPSTTLLHYAALKHDVQLMHMFINHGANCNALDSDNFTPLHYAVIGDDDRPDIVELLINERAIVDARGSNQDTPLFMAAQKGFYQSAEKLIAAGASIEAVDETGCNALHIATCCDELNMINVLISHNINVDATDSFGNTALHYAAERNADIVSIH